MIGSQPRDVHERLLDALLSPEPLPRLRALRPTLTGQLAELADLAIARLDLRVPDRSSPEAVLLKAIAGHPGLSLAELQDVTGLEDVLTPADTLRQLDLATDRRFERTDCWSRTSRGAQALRRLSG